MVPPDGLKWHSPKELKTKPSHPDNSTQCALHVSSVEPLTISMAVVVHTVFGKYVKLHGVGVVVTMDVVVVVAVVVGSVIIAAAETRW